MVAERDCLERFMIDLASKIEKYQNRFEPEVNNIRTDRTYIYESFLNTDGTDVKVFFF